MKNKPCNHGYDYDCDCNYDCNFNPNDNCDYIQDECLCCKNAFKYALTLLSRCPFNQLVDFSKFTFYGLANSTAVNDTVIKSLSFCSGDLLEIKEPTLAVNFTNVSMCNLKAFSFLLSDSKELQKFIKCLEHELGCIDPQVNCDDLSSDSCNCSKSIYSELASNLGNVNLAVSSFAFPNPLHDAKVIGLTDCLAWVLSTTTVSTSPTKTAPIIYVICLNDIEFIG